MRRRGIVRSPVEGLPVSVKDLFDVAGQVTRAGSALLADAAPAAHDATAVARLRAAGAVIVGRTNMVEFAFGGVGLNPHTGTPRNPWDRGTGRVPGGSSSGAGVAQADGMSVMSLGIGHARVGADPGGAVRRGRLQADGAARADERRLSAVVDVSIRSGRWPTRSTAARPTTRSSPAKRRPRSCRCRPRACGCWCRKAG